MFLSLLFKVCAVHAVRAVSAVVCGAMLCPVELFCWPPNSQRRHCSCTGASFARSTASTCYRPLAMHAPPSPRLSSAVGAPPCHGTPTRKSQARADPSQRSARAAVWRLPAGPCKNPPAHLVPSSTQNCTHMRRRLFSTRHASESLQPGCPLKFCIACTPVLPCPQAIKADVSAKRTAAFAKRLLQVGGRHGYLGPLQGVIARVCLLEGSTGIAAYARAGLCVCLLEEALRCVLGGVALFDLGIPLSGR